MKTITGHENYQAKVIEVKEYKKHPNADKLFIITVDFQSVITGVEPSIGDKMVYFPVLSKINTDFLRKINGFRESNLNDDVTQKGFFEYHGRVKPVKLRGIPSEGYLHPLKAVEEFLKTPLNIGDEFNQVNGITLCEKYLLPADISALKQQRNKQSKSPKEKRLIENQFKLSVDVDNIRKNMDKLSPEDYISITYKVHGTNFSAGNVLVKKNLKWYEKALKKLGVNIVDNEYDVVYSSRRVIKNAFIEKEVNHFYEVDIWSIAIQEIKDKIPKNFTVYGEIVGQTPTGEFIQKDYRYGCEDKKFDIYIFRVTFTNTDGISYNLSPLQILEFCEKYGFKHRELFFFYGKARDLFPNLDISNHWKENFIKSLEEQYTEKDCFMNKHKKLPEEGICIYKDSLLNTEVFKLKSFRFLEKEEKELEQGITNMENNG